MALKINEAMLSLAEEANQAGDVAGAWSILAIRYTSCTTLMLAY